jgi:hypothetical protein
MTLTPTEYSSEVPSATVLNIDGTDLDDWDRVAKLIVGHVVDEADGPFRQILATVRGLGCTTVVVEERYIDLDYRSEYSSFWSGRFEDRSPQAKRVHFFRASFDAHGLPFLPESSGYLGYCVIRPTDLGALGRTVVAPPRELDAKARLTKVVERPSLFGNSLQVAGVPFCQQDGELLRCAHAAAWVCHYVAFHHRIVARRLTAEIASMPSTEGSKQRPLPSTGLTGEQLQGVFSAIGIPAFFYEADRLPKLPGDMLQRAGVPTEEHNRRVRDERVFRVVCKYLNSGFPVVVLTESNTGNHAFTLVGWKTGDDGCVCLVACDDRVGPYEEISSPELDSANRGKWKGFMLPLPAKVYLTGEAAESRARQIVSAERVQAEQDEDLQSSDLSLIAPKLRRLGDGVSVRSRLIQGRRYKAIASRQGRHREAVRVARMAHLPHWIWVVEFQDSKLRETGKPCVLAEFVFDSTSHDERPSVNLVCTASVMIDARMAAACSAAVGDRQMASAVPWLGSLDKRKWRSLISDNTIEEQEYGRIEPSVPSDAQDK